MSRYLSFPNQCAAMGLPVPLPEVRFFASRKWRLDFGWTDRLLAVEVQGGTFVYGAHSRGAHLQREYEKLSCAATLGWRVLFVTPQQVKNGAAVMIAKAALEGDPARYRDVPVTATRARRSARPARTISATTGGNSQPSIFAASDVGASGSLRTGRKAAPSAGR